MSTNRRQALQLMGASLAAFALPAAVRAQDSFPSRPITMVCPYPPGGSTDQVARLVQNELAKSIGQTVIVENRGGANGTVGSAHVAKADPDGYTILLATQPIVTINPYLYETPGFDPLTDLTPITKGVNAVIALAVHPSVPANSLEELIELAKQDPGKVTYGSSGTGSPQHIGTVRLCQQAGIDMTHVPYKGGGPMVTDLVAGHINAGIVSLSALQPFGDRVRILAVGESERFAGAPDIPTIGETLPGFTLTTWLGFLGPKNMPAELAEFHYRHLAEAMAQPALKKQLEEMALPVQADGPQAMQQLIQEEYQQYGDIIRNFNITTS